MIDVLKQVFNALGIKSATVLTLTTICFNDSLTSVPLYSFNSYEQLKPLVKALLDAEVPVKCYWSKIDYKIIDERLGVGHRI